MRHGSAAAAGAGVGCWDAWLICASCSGWRRLSFADPVAVCVGHFCRSTVGLYQTLEAVPDPGRVFATQVLVDTDTYLEQNRCRTLDDGFMHAVFNPSFNAPGNGNGYRASTVPVRCWRLPAIVTLNRR